MNILYIIGFLLLFGAIGGSENGKLTILQCLLLSAIAFIILIVTKVKSPVKAATLARRDVPETRNDYI